MKSEFEENYHGTVHKHLLTKSKYYLFRAKVGEVDYWRYLNKGKTLDFGCGLGQFIYLRKDTAIGVEVSNFAIEFCKRKGLSVYNVNRLPKGKFDNILCVHTLEHLKLEKYVKIFRKLLKKNGRLLIVLPYPMRVGQERSFKKGDAVDYSSWNLGELSGRTHLRKILRDNGFEIAIEKFNYNSGYILFYKLPFKLAYPLLKLFSFLRNSKEYIILSIKS